MLHHVLHGCMITPSSQLQEEQAKRGLLQQNTCDTPARWYGRGRCVLTVKRCAVGISCVLAIVPTGVRRSVLIVDLR